MCLRLRAGLCLLVVCLWIVAESGPSALAKGRGGGHKGGGGRAKVQHGGRGGGWKTTTRSPGHGGSAKRTEFHGNGTSHTRSTDRLSGNGHVKRGDRLGGADPISSTERPTDGNHPWSMQRANEERKLDHRLGNADRLDQIAERNGNDRLHDTAERMRQKAYDHYDKRMAKIDSKDPLPDAPDDVLSGPGGDGLPEGDEVAEGRDLLDPETKLTGRENALYRQLRNEERKLAKRMETAQSLWDAYDETGDERLAEAAQRVEAHAWDHYEKRLDAIRSFQDRHDLPDMIGDRTVPTFPDRPLLGEPLDRLGTAVSDSIDVLDSILGP